MLFKGRKTEKSQYLDGSQAVAVSSRVPKILLSVVYAAMAVLFLLTSVNAHMLAGVAFAEGEEEGQKKIQDAADSYIPEPEEGEEDTHLFTTLEKFNNDSDKNNPASFAYVLNRMFTFNYMNNTQNAFSPDGNPKDKQCNVDDPNAGTLIYHNCDVPNPLTEVTQDFITTWTQQGAVGADTKSATLDSPVFGLPLGIPADGAPINPSERSVKYTGLELYGYNLKYSDYNGEWDHIKVMTSARTLSNFGFMEDLKMGVHTVTQGIAGGVQEGASNFMDGMSTGNFFGAIGGGFSGFFSGSAATGINTILDTSDHNVFSTYAWYRVGFGGTLYNARELSESEIATRYQNSILDMVLSKVGPSKAAVPENIQALRNGLPDPKEAISKCTVKNANGKDEVTGSTTIAPGLSKNDCEDLAEHAYEVRELKEGNPANDKASYTWVVDGSQKKETLTAWKGNNKELISLAETNGMTCELNTDEVTRADNIASYRLCWNTSYGIISANAQNEQQIDTNNEWLSNLFNPTNIMGWFTSSETNNNPNAPWNRYICVDKDGKDILNSDGVPQKLYDLNGDLNPGCNPVRPPIQNGFFGNGYKSDDKQPGLDTRWVSPSENLLNTIFPISQITTGLGNAGLIVASFATRVSNTVISFSFNPPLSALGIDTIIIKMIESFRESLFFPLATLFIGLAGLQIMWNVGRRKDYQNQAVSIVMLCLTIVGGTILMYKPAETVKAVDTIPSMVESAIMGSVFSLGNRDEDNLCYATGTIDSATFIDLEGNPSGISAKEGTRALMCENWRTFAFNPWVMGQWGTDYSNLYAAGSGKSNTMNNTNSALVGDAAVNMGGGVTEKNWALYQLEATTSGTAYHKDLLTPTGRVDSDFYRIVDMQAGPNNGAGTDPRYFQTWNGNDMSRILIGPMSAIIAIIGAITVIVYTIAKIQISVVVTIMLLMLPIMFLFGIHPTQGRLKLKGYIGSILGLMLQRIVLVLLLAVLFRIVTQLGSFSENYLIGALFTVAVCIFFLKARKDILRMVFEMVSMGFGQPVGQQFMDDPVQWANKNIRDKSASRGLIANTVERAKVGAVGFAGGAVGSYMASGAKGATTTMRTDAVSAMKQNLSRLTRTQRHRGYGIGQTLVEGGRAGITEAEKRAKKSPYGQEIRNKAFKQTKAYTNYESDLKAYKAMVETEENVKDPESGKVVETFKTNSDGDKVIKPQPPKMNSDFASSATSIRRTNHAIQREEKLDKIYTKEQEEIRRDQEAMSNNPDRYQEVYDDAKLQSIKNTYELSVEGLEEELKDKKKEVRALLVKQGSGALSPQAKKLLSEIEDLKKEIEKTHFTYNNILKQGSYSSNSRIRRDINDSSDGIRAALEKASEKSVSSISKEADIKYGDAQAFEDVKNRLKSIVDRTKNRNNQGGGSK